MTHKVHALKGIKEFFAQIVQLVILVMVISNAVNALIQESTCSG